jgi:hypothetical protein
MTKPILFALCLSAVTTASATTTTVTESGTWGNNCPAPYCTAPGATLVLSFQVDSSPTPITYNSVFFLATISDFTLSDNGVIQTGLDPETKAYFFIASDTGGFATYDDIFDVSAPSQLFTGPVSTPTFQPGNYPISQYPTIGNTLVYTYTNIDVSSAVPEPATYALALFGFGLLGCVRKRILPGLRSITRTHP